MRKRVETLSEQNKLELLAIPDIMKIKSYQPGKPIEEVKRELGLKTVVKLASNENPLGPSNRAIEAIRKCAGEINIYPDGGGYYLKKALVDKLGLEKEKIILGNGSDEIVSLITRVFLQKGEEAIMGDPSFLMYKIDTQLSQARTLPIPLNNFRLNLPAMTKAITPETKLIFISNPNNPTGTIVQEEEVKSFLKDLPFRIIVIFDEAYFEYVEDENYPQTMNLLNEKNNIIILRTFSKIYGLAGLRIGYGIARPQIIEMLNRARPPFNVNSLAQAAALASLKDENQIERSKKLIREEKEYLYSKLNKMKLSYIPTQANFILIKLGTKASYVERRLLQDGIIVRGMKAYNLTQYIRLTIGTREQNERFITALDKIFLSI